MRKSILIYFFLGLFSTIVSTDITTADIYRYHGHNGVIHYSNEPSSPRYRLFRKSSKTVRTQRTATSINRSTQKKPANPVRKSLPLSINAHPAPPAAAGTARHRKAKPGLMKEKARDTIQKSKRLRISNKKGSGRSKERPDTPWKRSSGRPQDEFESIIGKAAEQHDLPPALLKAMIKVESNFNPRAVSAKGATGLMQIMPMNYASLNIDNPLDPGQNVNGGSRYLKQMLDQFKGDIVLALAAYNAGPSPVERHGYRLPYRETRKYVQKVLHYYAQYKRQQSAQSSNPHTDVKVSQR